jgi:N-acetylglucosamine kinase-like BadF-type ATPase
MSPFIFSADLNTVSATVREIRAGLVVDQVDASWEEVRGDESAELTLRVIAADRAGDWAALDVIRERAKEIDAANPFGERLVDQLAALTDYPVAA